MVSGGKLAADSLLYIRGNKEFIMRLFRDTDSSMTIDMPLCITWVYGKSFDTMHMLVRAL